METPKKRNYLLMILLIIIILLVIWILYLLMNRSDTKMQNPTGNVDIFEITCDKDELCENIIIPTPTPTENPFDNDSSNEENQNQKVSKRIHQFLRIPLTYIKFLLLFFHLWPFLTLH